MSNGAASQVESNHAIYVKKYKAEAEEYHQGEVALMVDGEIKGYFPTASDAYIAGHDRPVSEANRSGNDHPATRSAAINPRSLLGVWNGFRGILERHSGSSARNLRSEA
ncbi:MAG: hypothetical protein F4110_12290 [Acidimicrobiaceae bacterium]|nr:hypothetical protein [Acidimicrobiaceae bacterium]MXZ99894.1 hypothetical protein [Acidimicrobiaceae bacterium]MYE75075.1 hypothetical protein [Acidimicrobiaceae bacterium]MYE98039.1 hypothetical protein [Acidimicrobiaceae bacterium]MYI54737.1 hypothetical protein [Acidimicrobiaceae bacterium]